MFVRFVLKAMHPDTGVEEGIFHAAYALRNDGEMPENERRELASLLAWFGENLDVPTRFNKTKSKGYYHRRPRVCRS